MTATRGASAGLRALAGARPRRAVAALAALALLLAAPPASAQVDETAFVDGNQPVPFAVLLKLGSVLPWHPNPHAAFLSPVYDNALSVTQPSQVRVHFLWEGGSWRNSLGYVTFTRDPFTIVDRQLVFPNASFAGSGGALALGDHSLLRDASGAPRTFLPGEEIAFFLVADGFDDEPQIAAWDAGTATIPSTDPAVNGAAAGGKGAFLSVDDANPELAAGQPDIARHAAVLAIDGVPGFLGAAPFVAVGFESRARTSAPGDFNDVVVALETVPAGALDTAGLATAVAGDPDGDGVRGTSDHYPFDPERALVRRFPPVGWNGLGLEDLYPSSGDGDFNDTFLLYRFDLVTDAANRLKDLQLTAHLLARGASLDHRLGLHLAGLPADADGTLDVERFQSDDAGTHVVEPTASVADLVTLLGRRIETVIPHTYHALPNVPGKFAVNTLTKEQDRPGASSRFVMTLDEAVPLADLGPPPWDLYWLVHDGTRWVDVHMPGFDAFPDHPDDLPAESGPTAYLDDDGLPWIVHVPPDWRFPLEYVSIRDAYPQFETWAVSHGAQAATWYESPAGALVSPEATTFMLPRAWAIGLPSP